MERTRDALAAGLPPVHPLPAVRELLGDKDRLLMAQQVLRGREPVFFIQHRGIMSANSTGSIHLFVSIGRFRLTVGGEDDAASKARQGQVRLFREIRGRSRPRLNHRSVRHPWTVVCLFCLPAPV